MGLEDILLSKEMGLVIQCTKIKLAIDYLNILNHHIAQWYFLRLAFTFSVTTTKRKIGKSDPSGSELAQV